MARVLRAQRIQEYRRNTDGSTTLVRDEEVQVDATAASIDEQLRATIVQLNAARAQMQTLSTATFTADAQRDEAIHVIAAFCAGMATAVKRIIRRQYAAFDSDD